MPRGKNVQRRSFRNSSIALVGVVVLDKNEVPAFVDHVGDICGYFVIAKSRARKLLKDAGIEDLYEEYSVEKVNYIVGKGGKFYPSYNVDNTSKGNDSKSSGGR